VYEFDRVEHNMEIDESVFTIPGDSK